MALAFQEWELLLVHRLRWDVCSATPNDFLEQILTRLRCPFDKTTIRRHAQTFVAACITEFAFARYPPSMIAASCVMAAIQGMSPDSALHGDVVHALQDITAIDADCLLACHEQLEQLLSSSTTSIDSSPSDDVSPSEPGKLPPNSSASEELISTSAGVPITPTDVRDVTL